MGGPEATSDRWAPACSICPQWPITDTVAALGCDPSAFCMGYCPHGLGGRGLAEGFEGS